MNTPLVSIVLPTYNGEKYLSDSIQSILAQDYSNWELIAVDDCSTDGTPDILRDYASRDARIRVVHNKNNLMLPRSLNRGFAEARGELLTWTSDDNMYREDALSSMVMYLMSHNSADIVYGGYSIIDENGVVIGNVDAEQPEHLFDRNVVNACFLYRRKVHDALGGYDANMALVEDWDFWIRAYFRFVMQPLNVDLYLYRRHSQSLTSVRGEQINARIYQLLKRALSEARSADRDRIRRAIAKRTAKEGWSAFSRGNRSRTLVMASRCIRYLPCSTAGWHLLACLVLNRRRVP